MLLSVRGFFTIPKMRGAPSPRSSRRSSPAKLSLSGCTIGSHAYRRGCVQSSLVWSDIKSIMWCATEFVILARPRFWIKDQYYNPHETWHSIDEVIDWFHENNIEYLNCYPPILGSEPAGMFDKTSAGSKMTRFLTQLSWLATISVEGALFELIGRKRRGDKYGGARDLPC